MRSKLFYTQLFGVLTLIVILLIAVPIYSNKIPKELTLKLQKKFQENGLSWVAVRVKGRDVTLSGIAPSIALHQQAIKIAEKIREIRVVHDKISPMVITPYSMSIEYKLKELIFKGYMPSKKSRDELFKHITKNYPTLKIINELDIGTGEPEEWNSLIMVISSLLSEKLDLGRVDIVDKKVVFSGKCQTSQQEKEILLYLAEYKKMGFEIQSRIVAMDEAGQVCQKKFNRLLSTDKIEFEAGKSIVKAQSQTLLKGLVDIAALCPNAKLKILGHTDSMGDNQKNLILSQRRAKSVVAKLFQLGIPLEQMEAVGKGENEPLADNGTKEGRAKNRRIEFKVIGY